MAEMAGPPLIARAALIAKNIEGTVVVGATAFIINEVATH